MAHLFKGKSALVIGGGAGLGRALCVELAHHKANVVVADIALEAAEETARLIEKQGGRARAERLDVKDRRAVESLIEHVAAEYGRLDYLFNNAGITICGETDDLELADWHRVFDVNFWGTVYAATAAFKVMQRQRSGYIVNTASVAGLTGAPFLAPFAASKSAVVGFTLSLREEAATYGIQVSAVCPGYLQKELYETAEYRGVRPEDVLKKIPFGAMKPKKAAEAVINGLAKNLPMIVFPLHARIISWLSRMNPSLVMPLKRKTLHDFRKAKLQPAKREA
jgi:NAD(P)-dependent dehydrogenase (short-subunit alcohol dehydrogenase family)